MTGRENGEKSIEQILASLRETADEVANEFRYPKKKETENSIPFDSALPADRLEDFDGPDLNQSINLNGLSSLKDRLSNMPVSGADVPSDEPVVPSNQVKAMAGVGNQKSPRKMAMMGDNRFSCLGSKPYIPTATPRETLFNKDAALHRQSERTEKVQKTPGAAFDSAAELMRPVLMRWIANQMPVIVEKALVNEATAGGAAAAPTAPHVNAAPPGFQDEGAVSQGRRSFYAQSPTAGVQRSEPNYVSQLGTVYAQEPSVQRKRVRVRQSQKPMVVMGGASKALRPILDEWVSSHMPDIVEKALMSEAASNTAATDFSTAPDNINSPFATREAAPVVSRAQEPVAPSVPHSPRSTVYAQSSMSHQKPARVRQVQEPGVVSPTAARALGPLMKHWLEGNMPSIIEHALRDDDTSDEDN